MIMENNIKNTDIELSVAIPFYNEEANVKNVISEMTSEMESAGINYELILVNNGSRDMTGDIIDECCDGNRRLKPVHLIANAGYGGGIITGLHHCRGRYLGYTWGDNQVKAGDLIRVYELVKRKGLDWAKGCRTERHYGLQRKIISRIYNILFRLFFRVPSKDINGVPKVFTRECFRMMDISSTNWFIDAEVILKSQNSRFKFGEVPLIYHERVAGSSSVNVLTVVEFIVNMVQHRLENIYAVKGKPSKWKVAYEVLKIYTKPGILQMIYTLIRMLLVSFNKIECHVPSKGNILDLGCGNGLFSHYLQISSPSRNITGVDLDCQRIEAARLTVDKGVNMEFYCKDVNDVDPGDFQIMTLIDLLHHMPYPEQEKLLVTIHSKLSDGGTIIVKDLKKDPRWKYLLHYIHDTISYKGGKLYFRSANDMKELLERVGFRVSMHDIGRWNIYPHIVYVCEKKM